MTKTLTAFAAALALAGGTVLTSADNAEAARYRFGNDEALHAYAKTGMTHKNKKLSLCYKTSTYSVFAPIYTTDEKVLCDVDTKMYWPVPTGDRLAKLQNAGHMPNPVPNYSRPALDYVFGYILWITLSIFGLFTIVPKLRRKRRDDAEPQAEQTA
jgi:hypothetical protein